MKVLFVRPYADIPFTTPPMGLLYLASCFRQVGEHEAKILDARLLRLGPREILDHASEFDPDAVGITGMTMEGPIAHHIAALLKERWPGRPVLLGGPYTSSDPEKAASDANIDFIFSGEAEKSFTSWVRAQTDGADVTQIPGVACRINGQMKNPTRGELVENLDDIPFPAWDLLDLESYFKKKYLVYTTMNPHPKRQRVLPMVSSRGCPFRCTYCHNIFGKKVRYRSIENVIEEMVLLKEKYGVQEIEFIDDIFNIDLPRTKALFRAIIDKKLNLNFCFPNGLRSDSFDEELMDLMKQAGVYRLVFAIESGSKRIQKLIRKNLNLEKARANNEMADKKGFLLGGFFIMGFPDEVEQEVWETINFALNSPLHTANFLILTPFPGTDVWQEALKYGVPIEGDFQTYYQVTVNLSKVPSERLEALRRQAIAKFFLNPKRVYRFVTRTPNFPRRSVEYGLILLLSLIGRWKK